MKKGEIIQSLRQVLDPITIPFHSLTGMIQETTDCWVTWSVSQDADDPAVCVTRIETFGPKYSRKRYNLPHHFIIVREDAVSSFAGRFSVAHEIGHIMLHFPKYRDRMVKGKMSKRKLGKNGEIRYTPLEETQAHLFAGGLCYLRTRKHLRVPEYEGVLNEHISEEVVFDEELRKRVLIELADLLPKLDKEFLQQEDGENDRIILALRTLLPYAESQEAYFEDSKGERVWLMHDDDLRRVLKECKDRFLAEIIAITALDQIGESVLQPTGGSGRIVSELSLPERPPS